MISTIASPAHAGGARLLTDADQNTKIATAAIYVAIGATIASLVSSVARGAVRVRRANDPMAGP